MIRQVLLTIGNDIKNASKEPLAKHPLANFIRHDAKLSIEESLGELTQYVNITGSPGSGNWAAVPWIAFLDPLVTNSAQVGYYVVYLFNVINKKTTLSLNQGTTAVKNEFGFSTALTVLQDRAKLIKARISDFAEQFDNSKIDLGSSQALPLTYSAGHVFGKTYDIQDLPEESELRKDLLLMINAYQNLTYRGGLEPSLELSNDDQDSYSSKEFELIRKYKQHRRIERFTKESKLAKKCLGYRCQVCSTKLDELYGSVGENYIEAHHLQPISNLGVGTMIKLDIFKDFSVLCPNCHRMIHRLDDPSDLDLLKNIFKRNTC